MIFPSNFLKNKFYFLKFIREWANMHFWKLYVISLAFFDDPWYSPSVTYGFIYSLIQLISNILIMRKLFRSMALYSMTAKAVFSTIIIIYLRSLWECPKDIFKQGEKQNQRKNTRCKKQWWAEKEICKCLYKCN